MRNISISTEVFAAIWADRQAGEETENDILARKYGVKLNSNNNTRSSIPSITVGVIDSRNGVTFQPGFRIFRIYKGKSYQAVAENGMWRRLDTNERYTTLNKLNQSIASGAENVWNGIWKYKDSSGKHMSIDKLRNS